MTQGDRKQLTALIRQLDALGEQATALGMQAETLKRTAQALLVSAPDDPVPRTATPPPAAGPRYFNQAPVQTS